MLTENDDFYIFLITVDETNCLKATRKSLAKTTVHILTKSTVIGNFCLRLRH